MHLLLVRHGETEWNVQRRIQGWTNSPLTDFGRQQIELLGRRLLSTPVTTVYSSPSIRTQETAAAAIADRDIPIVSRVELRETSWGKWEGKTAAEIAAEEPVQWEKFLKRGKEDPGADQADWEATTLVPEGESILQASTRINDYVATIVAERERTDDWILAVGHGGSLRFVVASLLKLRPSAARHFHLDNASLTHFTIEPGRAVLKLFNDTSHWSDTILP